MLGLPDLSSHVDKVFILVLVSIVIFIHLNFNIFTTGGVVAGLGFYSVSLEGSLASIVGVSCCFFLKKNID